MTYSITFWVYDAKGNIVANYPTQWAATEHAMRINGTWSRGRL